MRAQFVGEEAAAAVTAVEPYLLTQQAARYPDARARLVGVGGDCSGHRVYISSRVCVEKKVRQAVRVGQMSV
jgi:hypothetical protein